MGDHDEHRRAQLASFRSAQAAGVDCWLEISPPGPPLICPVAAPLAGQRFGHNDVPILPLAGCVRRYGCACCIVVETPPSEPLTPEQSDQADRDYEVALARLPEGRADAVRRALNALLRGFGIEP